jgi:hypothetical protein
LMCVLQTKSVLVLLLHTLCLSMLHCGGGFVLRHVCVCMLVPFDYCMVGRRAPFGRGHHRGLVQSNDLRLLLHFRTNGMVGCLLVALHVCVCIPLCRMGCWVLSFLLTRLRLVLARASRLLSFLMLEHADGRMFVVFVLCMSFVCLRQGIDVIAPPTRLPNLVPTYIQ